MLHHDFTFNFYNKSFWKEMILWFRNKLNILDLYLIQRWRVEIPCSNQLWATAAAFLSTSTRLFIWEVVSPQMLQLVVAFDLSLRIVATLPSTMVISSRWVTLMSWMMVGASSSSFSSMYSDSDLTVSEVSLTYWNLTGRQKRVEDGLSLV